MSKTEKKCLSCKTVLQEGATECPSCKALVPLEEGWLEKVGAAILKQLSDDIPAIQTWINTAKGNFPHGIDREFIARHAIAEASRWSGKAGFLAGFGDFAGPPGFASTGADMAYAAKLTVQMTQRIFFIYGHDLAEDHTKLLIVEALGGGGAALGKAAGKGAVGVGKKLTNKYLKGQLLKSITAFFARLGLRFSKAMLLRWMPVVGSFVNLWVNQKVMTEVGNDILNGVKGIAPPPS